MENGYQFGQFCMKRARVSSDFELCVVQTFAEAERHHWKSMEREWEKEKEKILNSLLGSTQELEFPTEAEVCCRHGMEWGGESWIGYFVY